MPELRAPGLGGGRGVAVPGGIGDGIAADLLARRTTVKSLAFVGTATTLPARHRVETQQALRAPAFSATQAMKHVKVITGYGPRRAGGSAERKAAEYVAAEMQKAGLKPGGENGTWFQEVPFKNWANF